MHLCVINPIGVATSLDLVQTPVWRLELRSLPWPARVGPADMPAQRGLALGVAYVVNGTGAFAVITAINCLVTGAEIEPIAALGFEKQDRHENKARLREALKVLFNADLKRDQVEEVCAKSAQLVDAYHDILAAMWANNTALNQGVGPLARGELDGWRWALLRERFSTWIVPGAANSPTIAAAASMSPAPGASVAGELAGTRDPMLGLPGLGAPPGSPKPSTKKARQAKETEPPPPAGAPPAMPPTGDQPQDPPAGDPPASTASE